jgi:hypothetical protein
MALGFGPKSSCVGCIRPRPELKLKYSDFHSAGRGWDRPCRFGGLRDVRRRPRAAAPLAALGPVRRRDADPVVATLAAALADYNTTNAVGERLIGEPVLNEVIVLPMITSVLAPILTERCARQLSTTEQQGELKRPPFVIAVSDDEHHTLVCVSLRGRT